MTSENFKDAIDGAKNFLILLFYVVLAILFFSNGGIKYLSYKLLVPEGADTVKLKFMDNDILLVKGSDAINTPNRVQTKNAKDIKVEVATIPIANILDSNFSANKTSTSSTWVYIGQLKNTNQWLIRNFDINTNEKKLTTLTDVYKRDALPIETKKDDWKLGKIIGLVHEKDVEQYEKIDTIKDNNVWALLKSEK